MSFSTQWIKIEIKLLFLQVFKCQLRLTLKKLRTCLEGGDWIFSTNTNAALPGDKRNMVYNLKLENLMQIFPFGIIRVGKMCPSSLVKV